MPPGPIGGMASATDYHVLGVSIGRHDADVEVGEVNPVNLSNPTEVK
jgi:hypothetical protein